MRVSDTSHWEADDRLQMPVANNERDRRVLDAHCRTRTNTRPLLGRQYKHHRAVPAAGGCS